MECGSIVVFGPGGIENCSSEGIRVLCTRLGLATAKPEADGKDVVDLAPSGDGFWDLDVRLVVHEQHICCCAPVAKDGKAGIPGGNPGQINNIYQVAISLLMFFPI